MGITLRNPPSYVTLRMYYVTKFISHSIFCNGWCETTFGRFGDRHTVLCRSFIDLAYWWDTKCKLFTLVKMSSRPSIIQDDLSGKPDICDPESEYKATKHCCQLCPPGFYLGEECHEPGQESACYPCHINFFMAFKNHARKCHRCKECFGDFEEKAACMPTMNRECRCISGKYQDHDGEICINCTPCTNQNTLQECTESTDTICINADDDQSEKIPKKTAPVGFIMAIVVFLLLIIVLLLVKYLPTLSKRLSIGIFCKKQRGSCSNKEQTEELTELYGVEPSN